jgi:hypothetical protein
MDVAEAVFPWVAVVIAIAAVVTPPLQMANPVRRRDMQLTLNLSRKSNAIVGAVWAAAAVVVILLGIAFVAVGRGYMWALIPLGLAQLFMVGYHVYIACLPFPDLEGEAEEDESANAPY